MGSLRRVRQPRSAIDVLARARPQVPKRALDTSKDQPMPRSVQVGLPAPTKADRGRIVSYEMRLRSIRRVCRGGLYQPASLHPPGPRHEAQLAAKSNSLGWTNKTGAGSACYVVGLFPWFPDVVLCNRRSHAQAVDPAPMQATWIDPRHASGGFV